MVLAEIGQPVGHPAVVDAHARSDVEAPLIAPNLGVRFRPASDVKLAPPLGANCDIPGLKCSSRKPT
jgi:hypothetical protein